MTNNDIFRRLRFCLNYNEGKILKVFQLAQVAVQSQQVSQWLIKDDEQLLAMNDKMLAAFLNGLIIEKRGQQKEQTFQHESKLTNNMVIQKLKIAFSLHSDEIINMLKSIDFIISKAELSALFRKPDHKHYRVCKDQFLRNFLTALQNNLTNSKIVKHVEKIETDEQTITKSTSPKSKGKDKRVNQKKNIEKTLYINPKLVEKPKQKSATTLKLPARKIWGEHTDDDK